MALLVECERRKESLQLPSSGPITRTFSQQLEQLRVQGRESNMKFTFTRPCSLQHLHLPQPEVVCTTPIKQSFAKITGMSSSSVQFFS